MYSPPTALQNPPGSLSPPTQGAWLPFRLLLNTVLQAASPNSPLTQDETYLLDLPWDLQGKKIYENKIFEGGPRNVKG